MILADSTSILGGDALDRYISRGDVAWQGADRLLLFVEELSVEEPDEQESNAEGFDEDDFDDDFDDDFEEEIEDDELGVADDFDTGFDPSVEKTD